jgi:hypothetical protein
MIVPDAPYILQNSRDYPGMAVECLLFLDYKWLANCYVKLVQCSQNSISTKKNRLHEHLDFIFAAEERLVPKVLCPVCEKQMAKFLAFVSDGLIGEKFICCQQPTCQQTFSSIYHWAGFHPLRPRTLSKPDFQKVSNKNRLITLLKSAYGLKARPDPWEILRLLQETF